MKIRPVYNFKYLPAGIEAMVIYPFILFRSKKFYYMVERRGEIYLRHELEHIRQVEQTYYYFWYLLYGLKYLFNLIKHRNFDDAYMNISYEVEARDVERQPLTSSEWEYFE